MLNAVEHQLLSRQMAAGFAGQLLQASRDLSRRARIRGSIQDEMFHEIR
eukprot:gene43817-50996_t